MTYETPIHPKRHLVMRRNWALEPQQHAIDSGQYHNNMNPQQFGQLKSTEAFNQTPLEG
jgi:hypothetical protein